MNYSGCYTCRENRVSIAARAGELRLVDSGASKQRSAGLPMKNWDTAWGAVELQSSRDRRWPHPVATRRSRFTNTRNRVRVGSGVVGSPNPPSCGRPRMDRKRLDANDLRGSP